MRNMFEDNNKDTRTSLTSSYIYIYIKNMVNGATTETNEL